jgi:hypothetical protein
LWASAHKFVSAEFSRTLPDICSPFCSRNRDDTGSVANPSTSSTLLTRRPLYITHEVNEITEPLLRTGVIDFLITQNIRSLIRLSRQVLIDLRLGVASVRELNYLPVQVVSEFTLFPGTDSK